MPARERVRDEKAAKAREREESVKQSTVPILLLGSTERYPDIQYVTGYTAADSVVLVQLRDGGRLVVPQHEVGRARRQTKGTQIISPEDLGVSGKGRRSPVAWAVALLRREGVRRVRVPADFPLNAARRLTRAGVSVFAAKGELFPARLVKRPDEIRCIREAQQAAVIAMRSAVTLIAGSEIGPTGDLTCDGVALTSEAVKQRIHAQLLERRCFCRDVIVACGEQAVDPHEQGSGALRAGETIVLDIFPQHLENGYWGDLTRTVARGKARPELKRLYAAVRAAQTAALNRVRPGVRCGTVHRAAADEMRRRGYVTATVDGRPTGFIHSTGHGVGLAIHEGPAVALSDTRLRAGMVITIEPGLYYPGLGGVRIEDTVVVTREGWRYLVPCEKRFEL